MKIWDYSCICLDIRLFLHFTYAFFHFFIFYFFIHLQQFLGDSVYTVCVLFITVCIRFKNDLMILFTYLKIILLKCYQFSVLTKISCNQTDSMLQLCRGTLPEENVDFNGCLRRKRDFLF